MMKKWIAAALMSCASSVVWADAAFLARADVQRYIDEQVKTGQFTRPELEAVFANVELKPNILKVMDRPSTSRPWYQFAPIFLNDQLVNQGVAFWKENAASLKRAEEQYKVAPEMIVAIIGIETRYGRNTGSFRVADALSTIGFDYPRRADYFRAELTDFLKLAKEENINALSLKGSYAGAMGLPQFMPSSYRKWAVDFDGDGHRDIWNNPTDAIGSVANYFNLHGWNYGDDTMIPVTVTPNPKIDELVADKFHLHYTVGDLKKMGVVPQAQVSDDVLAVLIPFEVAPNQTEYWIGLNNFYTITRYNKSTLYARVADRLANQIKDKYLQETAIVNLPQTTVNP